MSDERWPAQAYFRQVLAFVWAELMPGEPCRRFENETELVFHDHSVFYFCLRAEDEGRPWRHPSHARSFRDRRLRSIC